MFKRLKRKGRKGKVSLTNVKQKIDPATIWEKGNKIGEGAMGEVFKVANKMNKKVGAAKVLTIESKDDIEEFVTEVDALIAVTHMNVIKLFDAFMYQKKFWVVLELCDGGAFDDILIERKGQGLSEPQVKAAAIQVLNGIAHLHNLGIYHRDVKGSNLLLNAQGCIKLTDFGSCSMGNTSGKRHDTFLGSPYWMAPEVIECDEPAHVQKDGYTSKADVWAYGITIIELCQCDPPYQDLNPMRAMIRIVKNPAPGLEVPHNWSDALNDFLDLTLQKDQEFRATASELKQHSFVSGEPNYKSLIPLLAHSALTEKPSASVMLAAQLRDEVEESGFGRFTSDNSIQMNSGDDEEESFGWG